MKGIVFNIQKFSLHDGPGIRTTVFLKGCPLRCKWCSNPESQKTKIEFFHDPDKCIHCLTCIRENPELGLEFDGQHIRIPETIEEKDFDFIESCPHQALTREGDVKSVDEVLEVCLQDDAFYEESGGGVTISGGEGMSQPEFLNELIDTLKAHQIHLAIETTGAVSPEVFRELAPKFDLILHDMKHYDSLQHQGGTGARNERILDNLKWALENELPVIIRIPVIPGFNDSLEDAENFSRLLKTIGAKTVQLLPFHQLGQKKYEKLGRNYLYNDFKALYPEDLEDYRKVFLDHKLDASFD